MLAQPTVLCIVECINSGECLQALAPDRRFLIQFANGSPFDRLADLDLATGKAPAPVLGGFALRTRRARPSRMTTAMVATTGRLTGRFILPPIAFRSGLCAQQSLRRDQPDGLVLQDRSHVLRC